MGPKAKLYRYSDLGEMHRCPGSVENEAKTFLLFMRVGTDRATWSKSPWKVGVGRAMQAQQEAQRWEGMITRIR